MRGTSLTLLLPVAVTNCLLLWESFMAILHAMGSMNHLAMVTPAPVFWHGWLAVVAREATYTPFVVPVVLVQSLVMQHPPY